MASYQHLDLVERTTIKVLRLQGMSLRDIGSAIGRPHTTVSRELTRNHQGHPLMSGYVPQLAQNLADKRHAEASKRPRLKSQEVRDFVHEKLNLGWTPEQISGTIGDTLPDFSISYEAIYQYIYTDFRDGISLLARSHKQRYPRKYSKKSRGQLLTSGALHY